MKLIIKMAVILMLALIAACGEDEKLAKEAAAKDIGAELSNLQMKSIEQAKQVMEDAKQVGKTLEDANERERLAIEKAVQ